MKIYAHKGHFTFNIYSERPCTVLGHGHGRGGGPGRGLEVVACRVPRFLLHHIMDKR